MNTHFIQAFYSKKNPRAQQSLYKDYLAAPEKLWQVPFFNILQECSLAIHGNLLYPRIVVLRRNYVLD